MQVTALREVDRPAADLPAEDRALAGELYALITHLHRHCNSDLLEAVGGLDLSLSQIKLLHHLERQSSELTLKQGAEAVRVSLPAASRMVDDLVQRGFVGRHEDVTDRRMKRITLTDAGRDVIRRVNAARLTALEQFVSNLNAAERRSLGSALTKLLARDEIAAFRPDAPVAP